MIKAVIFDMDGLLIDSEPLWQEAEITVFNTVGIKLTPEMDKRTEGLRTVDTVEYWFKRYPWQNPSKQEVGNLIDAKVTELIEQKGKPKEGVNHIIEVCEQLNLVMAIASSSSKSIINSVIKKLGVDQKLKAVNSSEHDTYGKPNPQVYIETAQMIGVEPNECLVLEDSVNGVLSAKSANMFCIAVPSRSEFNDKRFDIADIIVYSLENVTIDMINDLQNQA